MKKIYVILSSLLAALLLCVGVMSMADADTPSGDGKLTDKPRLTLASLADGSFMKQYESYYTDFFPFRGKLLDVSNQMNLFYTFSSGEKNELVIEHTGGAELGGARLDGMGVLEEDPEEPEEPTVPTAPTEPEPPKPEEPEVPEVPDEPVIPEEPEIPEEPAVPDEPAVPEVPDVPPAPPEPPKPPVIDIPEENEVTTAGTIIISGDRAMEVPNRVNSAITRYAATVSKLAEKLGQDVRVFSLLTPNGAQFYTPLSMHTGSRDQRSMIQDCYDQMTDAVHTVDAFTPIEMHADEYLYFRTDHHWTQLGAYYAYTAFCETAGFTAPALSEYESGVHEGFLGSMYNWTKNYPQSAALKNHPDTLTYYLPRVETSAKYYLDSTLKNGIKISVVSKNVSKTSNKYLCYIAGDTPICIIETSAPGGTCMVLKESYGNAFVPFLTEHYSKIIVVDPREFNGSGEPTLDVISFAKSQGVNDVVVINYPFMINNGTYVTILDQCMP